MRQYWFVFLFTLQFIACSGDINNQFDAGNFGTEGHQCYYNHTCDMGLVCLSNICVRLPNDRDSGTSDVVNTIGTESKSCYPNNSCNTGLTCLSNICVRLPDFGIDGMITTDLSHTPKLDIVVVKPDVITAKLDMSKPDMSKPKPDTFVQKPDMSKPDMSKPDMYKPKPDTFVQKPDMSRPDIIKPDVMTQKPDLPTPASWKVEKFPIFGESVWCGTKQEDCYDGQTHSSNAITSIFGNNSNNIWAIGTIYDIGVTKVYEIHWDGIKWTINILSGATGRYNTIWVSPTGDRFAGGVNGDLFINGYKMQLPIRNDPTLNGLMGCGPTWGGINGIWGTSSTDVFITTDAGRILHFDGMNITIMPTPELIYNSPSSQSKWRCPPGYSLTGIWGTDHNNIYAVGMGPFHTIEPNLLTCGEFGECPVFSKEVSLILHFDGQTWKKVVRTWPITTPDGRLVSIWGADKNTIFASGGMSGAGTVLSNKGGTVWQMLNCGVNLYFDSIGGSSTTTWFVGSNSIYGGIMTYNSKMNLWDFPSIPGSAPKAHAIWLNDNNIFLAGWSKEIISTIPYREKWTPAIIYYK